MRRDTRGTWLGRVVERLLQLPIFVKILVANSVITAAAAVVTTWATTWHVQASPPHTTHYEMMALFTAGGLLVTLPINWAILHFALLPLWQVEATARAVQAGHLAARVQLTKLRDPHTDRLAATLNGMLDQLGASAQALQAYTQRLQALSGRVLAAQEEERVRIARELHDQTGQELTSLLIGLRVLRGELEALGDTSASFGADAPDDGHSTGRRPAADTDSPPSDAQRPTIDRSLPGPERRTASRAARQHFSSSRLERARGQAAALAEVARQALDDVRRLALELRPKTLEDLGLMAALRWYAEEWGQQVGLDVRFVVEGDAEALRARPDVEIALYRVVQEALTNAAKHARARHVMVRLAGRAEEAQVEVVDDGAGFDPAAYAAAAGAPSQRSGPGLGLFGMQERMALVGGMLQIEAAAGAGTRIVARVPLAQGQRLGVTG